MSRCRALVVVLSLALALPSAAFGQGAGDEQYRDPFGDEQGQQGGGGQGRAAQDDGGDGLSDAPPVTGGGGQQDPVPDDPAEEPQQEQQQEQQPPQEESALPNTGSDPRLLALVGLLFVLVGVGLRLRTIDPDAY